MRRDSTINDRRGFYFHGHRSRNADTGTPFHVRYPAGMDIDSGARAPNVSLFLLHPPSPHSFFLSFPPPSNSKSLLHPAAQFGIPSPRILRPVAWSHHLDPYISSFNTASRESAQLCERWSSHWELRCFAFKRILVFFSAKLWRKGGSVSSDNGLERSNLRARLACDNELSRGNLIWQVHCRLLFFTQEYLLGFVRFGLRG